MPSLQNTNECIVSIPLIQFTNAVFLMEKWIVRSKFTPCQNRANWIICFSIKFTFVRNPHRPQVMQEICCNHSLLWQFVVFFHFILSNFKLGQQFLISIHFIPQYFPYYSNTIEDREILFTIYYANIFLYFHPML